MYLFVPCLLTVGIETAFFFLLGYRDRLFVTVCVCANAVTNLSLNLLLLGFARLGLELHWLVYGLEALAVAVEFWIYSALRGRSWKLFGLVLAANALSYGAGLLIFGHV